MADILVIFAHPKFERSRVNKALVEVYSKKGVTFHDLYEVYPDFNIDLQLEKDLLSSHDIIIWHHPFYWYSCPPLMKQWIDVVLEYDWAYGPNGNALKGKQVLSVITTGGSEEVYCTEGSNNYPVHEFLRPFEQTARLCGMSYLPPFTVMGTYRITNEDLKTNVEQFDMMLTALKNGLDKSKFRHSNYLNHMFPVTNQAKE